MPKLMRAVYLGSALVLITSCGASPPQSVTISEAPREPTHSWNEAAARGGVVDTLHGVEVEDPYRSLEEDSPETQAWVNNQTARTEAALAPLLSEERNTRISELLSIGSIGMPVIAGDWIFYRKREGDREQPILFGRREEEVDDQVVVHVRPLVDPQSFGERAALDWFYPSPTGRYIAFGISHNGDERSTLHILETGTERLLDERIGRTKWTSVSWLNDESGFYYRRYPNPGEEGFDADHEDSAFPRVYFHLLGQPIEQDVFVFGGEASTDFPGVTVSDDDRWLVLTNWRGWSASDVHLFSRGSADNVRVAPTADHPAFPISVGEDHKTSGTVVRGTLYLMTDKDAPNSHLLSVDALAASRGEQSPSVLVAEADSPIEDWEIVGDTLTIHYVQDVRSQLRVFNLSGEPQGEIPLPTRGSVTGLSGQPDGQELAFGFSSFLQAPRALRYSFRTQSTLIVDAIDSGLDLSRYELTVERVRSADGTMVPVQILHRRDLQRNGNHPVLLTAYGGFNISLLPSFRRSALYWLEQGGVYAVANLRGGSEFGETWHRAGNLENKHHVFEDMEAVIRWFSSSGISNPNRIAITGGSNGGLLMGAMITRAPETFRAAATYVGLYDMVRYHHFPPAELWISEYGSADEPEQFSYLHEYSPYHRIRTGVDYPAVLVETADHDSRVFWGHSTKFAARLQQATSSPRPIYFYMERQVGHGAGTRLSDSVRRYSRMYAFFESQLEVR